MVKPCLAWALSALALRSAQAYLVPPDGTAAPGATEDCSAWVQDSYLLTCAIIEESFGMTEAQFEEWNPSTALLGDCTMIEGLYYCVEVNFQALTTTSSASATTTSVSVATSSAPAITSSSAITAPDSTITSPTATQTLDIPTPEPTQAGMVANCESFALVSSTDTCSSLASEADISLDDFYAWNPAVGDTCANLIPDYWVCVGVAASGSTTTASSTAPTVTATVTATASTLSTLSTITTTSTTTNGIVTPTPVQTGMVSNCDDFYLVQSGDSCSAIATAFDISLDNFYAWNPAVGDTCSSLDLGDWVCIGLQGSAPTQTITTKPTTATTTGNGISTPTPVQTGMVSDCDDFYLIQSGDTCSVVAADFDISLTDFYTWNPAVGDTCAGLELGVFVCIGLQGSAPTQTITTVPTTTATTTSSGNGITTPTPYQTGMVTNCDEFYLVSSGDSCSAIASAYDISLTDFYDWNPAVGTTCAYLDLGDYVCVGIL